MKFLVHSKLIEDWNSVHFVIHDEDTSLSLALGAVKFFVFAFKVTKESPQRHRQL